MSHRHDATTPGVQPRARDGRFGTKLVAEADAVDLTADPSTAAAPTGVSPWGPLPDGVSEGDIVESGWCENCSAPVEEGCEIRLYECGECGTTSSERRCDQCNKFMARSDQEGCPSCEEPISEDRVALIYDHDGVLIPLEDYEPDGEPLAVRAEQAKAAHEEQLRAEAAARLASKRANSETHPAAAIEPGARLIDPDSDRRFGPESHLVVSTRAVDSAHGPLTVMRTWSYNGRVVVRRADAPVHVSTKPRDEDDRSDGEEARAAAALGPAVWVPGFVPDLSSVSTPCNDIEIKVGHNTRDQGTLPVISVVLGRRGSSGRLNGYVYQIAAWDDPAEAEESLRAWESAADALEEARRNHPPTRAADDLLDGDAENSGPRVSVEEGSDAGPAGGLMNVDTVGSKSVLRVGTSSWYDDRGALLAVDIHHSSIAAIEDPQVVRDMVAAARSRLGHLTGVPADLSVVDDPL